METNLPDFISLEEINTLPIGVLPCKPILIDSPEEARKALSECIGHSVVGFDTETRPSFTKGVRHKVSLIQIALPYKVFLIRLRHVALPLQDVLIDFLENPKVCKSGVGIKDDILALRRLFVFTPENFIDLSKLSRKAEIKVAGIKKLAGLLLGIRMSKRYQTSNWDAPELSEKQIHYAALDAWVSLQLYNQLQKRLSYMKTQQKK